MKTTLSILVLAGCQTVPDAPPPRQHTCKTVVEKSAALVGVTGRDVTMAIGECEQKEWSDVVRTCLDAAATKEAVVACGKQNSIQSDLFAERPDFAALIGKMTEFKNRFCACTDAKCAEQVSNDLTAWGQEIQKTMPEPPKFTDEQTKQMAAIGEEMGKCMQKSMGGAPGTPPP